MTMTPSKLPKIKKREWGKGTCLLEKRLPERADSSSGTPSLLPLIRAVVAGTRTAQGGRRIGGEEEDAAAGLLKRGKDEVTSPPLISIRPRQTPAADDAVAPTQTTASAGSKAAATPDQASGQQSREDGRGSNPTGRRSRR